MLGSACASAWLPSCRDLQVFLSPHRNVQQSLPKNSQASRPLSPAGGCSATLMVATRALHDDQVQHLGLLSKRRSGKIILILFIDKDSSIWKREFYDWVSLVTSELTAGETVDSIYQSDQISICQRVQCDEPQLTIADGSICPC
ncbi:hypothetical protein ABW19_dt0205522 [Dactylella cylindrospora]|nr:hypothetical protein ABW19_dt0205522 [Dactylella cylindrospora]